MQTTHDVSTLIRAHAPSRRLKPGGWAVAAIVIGAMVSLPQLVVLAQLLAGTSDSWTHLSSTVLPRYVTNSVYLMVGVGLLSTAIGVPTAWFLTTFNFPGRSWLEWAQLLPLAVPSYIIAYCYTDLLEFAGPVQTSIRTLFGVQAGDYPFPNVRSLGGAVVVLSLALYPYIYLLTRAAFVNRSASALDAGHTLGCGTYQVFWRVALPLARPAILAGVALVLMETLADFGTVDYFGVPTFTTGIFRTWFGLFDTHAALQLSAVLLIFVVVLFAVEHYSRRESRYHNNSNRQHPLTRQTLEPRTRWVVFGFCVTPVVLGFAIPALQLTYLSLSRWSETFDYAVLLLAFNSLGLALITAIVILVPAVVLVVAQRSNSNPLTRMAVRISTSGYAVPGTVISLAVLIPFGFIDNQVDSAARSLFGVSTGLLLSGTFFALIFAYCVRFLAAAFNALEAGMAQLQPTVEESARTMGASKRRVLTDIYLPVLRGSVLTALLVVFVDTLKELPATLVLRPFDFNTLAVRTYELASDERLADAALPALLIVLAGLAPVILLSRGIRRSRPGIGTIDPNTGPNHHDPN